MIRVKHIFNVFLIITIAFNSSAQDKLTLEEALSTALENNYSIKIARNDNRIANNNYSLGNAGFLPQINATATKDYGVEDTEQVFSTGQEQNRENAKSNSLNYGANLNWTVFDGLHMFFNYDRLEALQFRSEAELQFAVESLIYQVQQAFLLAALEKERLSLFNSNLGLSEIRLEISKDKYEVGGASKLEYLQAQVDYNADKSAMIQQLEVLAEQKYALINLMGVEKDTIDFEIDYELDIEQDIALDNLLENISVQNKQLKSLRYAIDASLENKKMLKAQRYPELDLYLGYNSINIEAGAGFLVSRQSNEIFYGATARWNIFNGFNLQRQIQNSTIQMENAQLELDRQELQFQTEVRAAYLDYKNNLILMELEVENLDVARENNEIAQERYRIGLSDALELREAQLNLVNAELRYQNAAFAAKLAALRLKFISGGLVRTN